MQMIDNIPVWGAPDEGAVSQIKTCAKTADRVALMADHHKAYAVPIGGVVAYRDSISPSGVGFDIACGNKAVLLDMPGSSLRKDVGSIMDSIWQTISFGVGRRKRIRPVQGLSPATHRPVIRFPAGCAACARSGPSRVVSSSSR
jgi:tRNA-splicing ligase RtcB (3'-phosphate/5'-hydroxy nucleic acid ligase)